MIPNGLRNLFRSASAPKDTIIFAIGDIHGYPDALRDMLRKIDQYIQHNPAKKIEIVFLGDYVNRGPGSKEVLDILVEQAGKQDGIKRTFLKGNHEIGMRAMLGYNHLRGIGGAARFFLDDGGLETLVSYGVDVKLLFLPREKPMAYQHLVKHTNRYVDRLLLKDMQQDFHLKIPQSHIAFLETLQNSYESGSYLFAHAGVDPRIPLNQQKNEILTGVSEEAREFTKHTGKLEKIVVHGHTISERPYSTSNQIGVDTGVYRNGVLSCAVLQDKKVNFLQARTDLPRYKPKVSRAQSGVPDGYDINVPLPFLPSP